METKQKSILKKRNDKPVVSDSVKNHADDPFVSKQVERAKDFLAKHPIPDWILKKSK